MCNLSRWCLVLHASSIVLLLVIAIVFLCTIYAYGHLWLCWLFEKYNHMRGTEVREINIEVISTYVLLTSIRVAVLLRIAGDCWHILRSWRAARTLLLPGRGEQASDRVNEDNNAFIIASLHLKLQPKKALDPPHCSLLRSEFQIETRKQEEYKKYYCIRLPCSYTFIHSYALVCTYLRTYLSISYLSRFAYAYL